MMNRFTHDMMTRSVLLPLLMLYYYSMAIATAVDLSQEPGHLKRFGTGRPVHNVKQIEGFPFTKDFFNDHVKYRKPLLMKGAANMSRAFQLWTDDYFLQADEPEGHRVSLEQLKKEDRSIPLTEMSMKEYVKIYNHSSVYMVHPVPEFLKADVILPGPLQCGLVQDTVVETMMWFSSGGTVSVVHFDPVDIINCVFRGQKEFTLVEPKLFAEKVGLDELENEYSTIDADRMDYLKNPGLAEIEYYRAVLDPGDCFYIPYRWVHQVRSHNSNVAVNIWWDAYLPQDLDLDQCPDAFDPEWTIDKVKMMGYSNSKKSIGILRDYFLDWTLKGPINVDSLSSLLCLIEDVEDVEMLDTLDPDGAYRIPIKQIFDLLNQNNDDLLDYNEVESAKKEMWRVIIKEHLKDLDERLEENDAKWNNLQATVQAKEELKIVQAKEEL